MTSNFNLYQTVERKGIHFLSKFAAKTNMLSHPYCQQSHLQKADSAGSHFSNEAVVCAKEKETLQY